VRALLTAQGVLVHGALAVDKASTEWKYTEADLGAIAPPLTRILNRYEPTRAAAGAGDELALGVGLLGYAARSISERRRALAELAEPDHEPDELAADAGDATAAYVAPEPEPEPAVPGYPPPDSTPPITSPRRR
jgi:hypothetical protein